ncbi:hypothetical protein [Enhygromyxa salina]|uniref:Uncharacterized protein n=1 Tax=Enhygromyxa salina TaxID=215803 RepID=A0A2S9YIV4_9BACT|nr:hypothetical protein [Enhygromyxa salina]PRQ05038.1 hypothetical protein ENSA7_48210 [Enhygromyxa salina]
MDWSVLEVDPGRTLERALVDDPRDREAWAIYADFISGYAPRFGERILLELHRDASQADERAMWTARVRDHDRRHRREWIDPGLARLFDRRGKAPKGVDLDWRFGFIFGLRLDGGMHHDEPGLDASLAAVLESPLSRFMAQLSVDFGTRPSTERDGVRALIRASSSRLALRELRYNDGHGLSQIDELLAWAPRLERLHVHGRLRGKTLEHARLRELRLQTHEEPLQLQLRRPAQLPRLESLAIVSRASDRAETLASCVRALLDGAELTALESLALVLPEAGEWVVHELAAIGLIQQLRVFEIPNSGFGPIAAGCLGTLSRRGQLNRLERLAVPGHDMHPASLRLMQAQPWELVLE